MTSHSRSAQAAIDDLLNRAVERTPLRFGPGHANSGAPLEAVRLEDGTCLVVKRFSPATDLLMRLTHDHGRAATLWTSGVLARMPPVIDHATIAAATEGESWVLVMADVGEAIIPDDRLLTREECQRVFAAAAQMHETFASEPIAGLCSVVDWMTFMTPSAMEPWRGSAGGLPDWVLRGWETFFAVAPRDIAEAIAAIHARPEPLAAELERGELTLLHGDIATGNLGLTPDRVVILDWALATWGPAALDFAGFLANFRWRLAPPAELLIDDIRAACGDRHDERMLQLALLATFTNYGWLPPDYASVHPDSVRRAREQACFAWWIDRVRHALETTWSPS